jgi:acetyltransferase
VLPQDDVLIGEFVGRLSAATRYNRFHGAVRALSAETLRRMSCIDYQGHLGFVVTTQDEAQTERVLVDARFAVDPERDSAEFALVVDDGWQRRGLGQRAMLALAEAARCQGLRWLHGSVLGGNAPMLALMRRCDYCCSPDVEDDALVHVETCLKHMVSAGRNPRPMPTLQRLRHWLQSRADLA